MSGTEIEDDDDSIEVALDPDTLEEVEEIEVDIPPADPNMFDVNFVDILDSETCQLIGSERQEKLAALRESRASWEERLQMAVKWLGLSADEDTNLPTEDSCSAVHPILMENVVKFQAKAIQELWPARGPVKTKLKGYVSPEREKIATRVRTHMNYQLTEQVPGFYNELERNLFRVAFMGIGIRKAGWNSVINAPDPTVVNIENFFVDNTISHLRFAEEHIELMDMTSRTMDNLIMSGKFSDCDDEDPETELTPDALSEAIATAQGFDLTGKRQGYRIGESHCYLDLDGADPLAPPDKAVPYVVHFNVDSGRVYAIRRNWREGDLSCTKQLRYTVDNFIPAFGFYSLGFAHLIGDLAASSTTTLRSLVDAGQFNNWQAGFKSKDAKFSNADTPLGFGEFRDVNLSPEELKNAFLPLPSKEPSLVLFELLKFMVAAGQRFADATDEVVSGATNYGPAATTLALLEASGRFYSSVHKRLHQSQGEFFKMLGELNCNNLPDRVEFVAGDENAVVLRTDYDSNVVDIIPASDPNALTETQRVARAQIEVDMAARFPQLHDMREALRRFYAAMGADNVDKLMPVPGSQAVSADPMSEIKAAMTGQPIKAEMGQNHQAHVVVKEAFLKSPQMQGVNDPTVAVGLQLLKANISEHKTLMFVAQVMQMAQAANLSPQDESVQAIIAEQMVAMSAASGMGGQESIESQMLQLNKDELEVAKMRIESQDARENAKLNLKREELAMKRLQLLLNASDKNATRQIDAAGKVLDLMGKQSDTALEPLGDRVA